MPKPIARPRQRKSRAATSQRPRRTSGGQAQKPPPANDVLTIKISCELGRLGYFVIDQGVLRRALDERVLRGDVPAADIEEFQERVRANLNYEAAGVLLDRVIGDAALWCVDKYSKKPHQNVGLTDDERMDLEGVQQARVLRVARNAGREVSPLPSVTTRRHVLTELTKLAPRRQRGRPKKAVLERDALRELHTELQLGFGPLAEEFKRHDRSDAGGRTAAWTEYERAHHEDAQKLEVAGFKRRWLSLRFTKPSALTAAALADAVLAYAFNRTPASIQGIRNRAN